ncbi:hypothetical protein Arnit_0485 [Arcobacter nitrofigilis DSM 7299]|uniref:Uncharacterized protein n=1 Tax=Arcobacter nitrofigilis (strain ATCC 33309 / DSM 7299 / CCUG 15893 / LMG 7604 / NCTC 12251 / CI) TaxID=572480 RepID=D5UZB3_ARCNC|nr:hypothetical protein [Arcobacter nitrofigilis]ADG92150.1 hypothetical protein Arnit_0485 [Arcobacter nitrofigilis DSM 7299]
MKIKKPIYVISLDSREVIKYDSLEYAQDDLEAYDLDEYKAYDSKFRKLELYKLDKYNRVGFRLIDHNCSYPDELEVYIRNYLEVIGKSNIVGNLEHLLLFIESEN